LACCNRTAKQDSVSGTENYTVNDANMLLTRGGNTYTNDANGNTPTGAGRADWCVVTSQTRKRKTRKKRRMPGLFALDTPPRIDEPELIDDPDQPYEDFRASMTDVRHANFWLGGTAAVTWQMRRWLRQARTEGRSLTLLDVATGSGDIPQALLKMAAREGVTVRILGLDNSVPILRFAREVIHPQEPIRLLQGDAFHLPFAQASCDYALCSLAFHHFSSAQCVQVLREMERVTQRGWLVNDIRRAWSAWYLIRIITALTGMNRMTRHDGPASVLRAYTPDELRGMARELGLQPRQDFRLRRSLFYRMALIRNKTAA
jgi:ubiquinone/menaquinone biosynthesis C-methylase UbiE